MPLQSTWVNTLKMVCARAISAPQHPLTREVPLPIKSGDMSMSTQMWFPRQILIWLIALIAAILWYQPTYAADIQVDDTGCSALGPTYCTIQQAVAVAVDDDVINVNPGFYSGVVSINKSVTIQAVNGPGTWLLTGAFHLQVDEITIDGFSITGATVPAWGGGSVAINIDGPTSGHVIQNNEIAGHGPGANRIGIQVGYDADTISFLNNTIKDWNTGIYLNPSSGHTIENNIVQDNVAGIGSDGISNTTIQFNTFTDNTEGFGASAVGANIKVHYNDFLANDAAINHYGGVNDIEARANWYGDASGPDNAGPGTGDDVSTDVIFCPWLDNVQGVGGFTNAATFGLAYSPNDPIPYCNIQDAVDISTSGQTVTTTAGIFNGSVLINKPLTLEGAGAGTNSALHTILDGTGFAGNGITLTADIANITIQDLRVQDFTVGTGTSGIRGTRNNSIAIQNVHVDNNGSVGNAAGGIFLGGPINGVTINNVRATNNWSRGIVIWDGLKQNISITNNYVAGNDCCGIELQDGTATGVTITGNVVENNADSGMAFIGLQGPGANLIANNHVRNNDRFGIEIKLPNGNGADSGPGSIVVSGNIITQTTLSGAEERDLAGIAVYRRGWVAGSDNIDIPNGVVVKDNTVTGIAQTNVSSDSEGFCIVVEGTNMQVLSNTVTSCDVGIQMQDGHTPYTANTNVDGDQSDLADQYFGRGNSPLSSGVIYYNNVAGNTAGIRNVGVAGNIDARANWYGNADGPGPVGPGSGASVSTGLTFCPWLDDVSGLGNPVSDGGYVVTTGDPIPYCAIQPAIDASGDGDTVSVYPGDYSEFALDRPSFPSNINFIYDYGLYIVQNDLTVQGVAANGDPITDASATLANIKTNATNNFGYSGIFVVGDRVTLAGLKIQENLPGNNKTIEIIGDAFTLKNSHVDVAPDGDDIGGAIYFGDWQYDDLNDISYIQSYTLTGNIFDHGSQIALSNGVGDTGDVEDRLIANNQFRIEGRTGPAISFNGAGGVPWYVYPVGAAIITGNDFSGGGQYIRARGTYDNAGMNWTDIWNDNAFDRAVVTLVGPYASPFDVRAYSYLSGSYTFTNVRLIGGTIQPHISDIAQPDDTVFVAEGIYNENIVYDEAVNLKGSGSGPDDLCGVGDPDTQTIIRATTGNLLQMTASGPSSANKLLLEDIRLELQSTTGSQYGIGVATNVNNVELNNVRVIGNAATTSIAQRGLVVSSAASISNWDIVDSSFNCLFVGVWFAKETVAAASAQADNILVTGSDFRLNGIKGMYVEKLSNATITNNEFIGNSQAIDKISTGAAHSAGLDINLKFGSYSTISVLNNIFTSNGLGASEGAALLIKARDDAPSYNSIPASLVSVTVASNVITGNERGIRFGEPNKTNAGPTQVDVNHNTIVTNTQTVTTPGSTYGGVIDWTSSGSIAVNRNAIFDNTTWNIAETNGGVVNGTCNWYDTSAGPDSTVANTVNPSPWLITSDLDGDCMLGSLEVNLAVVGSLSYGPATWTFSSTLGGFNLPQVGGTQAFPNLGAATYVVTQTVDPNYSLLIDCGSGVQATNVVTIPLAMAENASCTFTNTLKPATLTVNKVVVNNDSGTADASDFPLFVDSLPVSNSVAISVTPGTHIVTEDAGNYIGSFSGDCAANGTVSLAPGESKTCTLTNDDPQQGTLNLTKVVVGGSSFAPGGGWQFYLDSTPMSIGSNGGSTQIINIPPGSYTISEVVDSDYVTSFSCSGATSMLGSSASISFTLGQTVSCVFTNTVKNATLTVNKVVINNNGGDVEVGDFPLFVDGNSVTSGVAISVTPGTHIITENAGTYTGSFSGDCAANGTINLLPGETKSCTVTNNDPGQGTLNLTKVVVGGATSAPADGWHFFLGSTPITLPIAGGNVQFTDLQVGSYIISEVVDSNYTTSFSCGGVTSAVGSSTLITFTLGSTINCTFTNTVNSATLTVNKVVINDNGGDAEIADFPLFVDGNSVTSGVTISITPGMHTVSEDAGIYIGSFSGDCSSNGSVRLLPGENKTCTLTNNDPGQGTLNLTKVVVGSSAFAPAGGWQFTLGDTEITIAATGGSELITDIEPGTYTISEEVDADYITTVSCGDGTTTSNSAQFTVALGETINCTFTNTLRDATLMVTKVVVNDNGGTAEVADFPLFVNAITVTSGVSNTFAPGSYVVTEGNADNYFATFSGDCSANGAITLAPGDGKSCTITNDDIAEGVNVAAITLVKTVGVIEGVCTADITIGVLEGETVYYCYTVTNSGNVTLTEHTLVDNRLGALLDAEQIELAPGETITSVSLGIEASALIEEETINTATWTAVASEEALLATASSAATVTIGFEDYEVTIDGTYIPPAGGSTTGGQMIYDINVLNTGTTTIKTLTLSYKVPVGTTFSANDDGWSCADGAPAGSECFITIIDFEPDEDVDVALNLDIIAEIDIDQLVLELVVETPGTGISPTAPKPVAVIGPDALPRLFMYMPALGRTDE